MDISGKVGLITGGADGIGKVLAENLLKKGVKGVTIVDIREDFGRPLKNSNKRMENHGCSSVKQINVINKAELQVAFQKTIEKFGVLHIVCNNAGFANEIKWEDMFRVNLNGTVNGTLLAIEHMNDTEVGGVVVNISSLAGMMGIKQFPLYGISKEAVNAFSRNVALYDPTAQRKKIRINIVCPAKVDKPLSENAQQDEERASKLVTMLKPENRAAFAMVIYVGSMQDVANTMLMLIEEAHNGKTALVFNEFYPIVDDPQQQFRQEVLHLDEDHFDNIMAAIAGTQKAHANSGST